MKPYLNAGCGKIIMPRERPSHHALVDANVYEYPEWLNVDRIASEGVDLCVDLFRYPWPFENEQFAGALVFHLAEHIPQEIFLMAEYTDKPYELWTARERELSELPNGFYAFFAELHRILEAGAIAHLVVPYAGSRSYWIDPDHRRSFIPATFSYLCEGELDAPFVYPRLGVWTILEAPIFARTLPEDSPFDLEFAMSHFVNAATEFYIKLQVVK